MSEIEDIVFGKNEEGMEAEIVDIEVWEAKDVFGVQAIRPEREMLMIELDIGYEVVIPLPQGLGYEDGEYIIKDTLKVRRSLMNENSKFRKFVRRYESAPKIGMKVVVCLDNKGFVRVRLD